MFREYILLTSLNLSNFDTSKVKHLQFMFTDCLKLEYINMNNFNDSKANYTSIFSNVPNNVVVCLYENDSFNYNISSELKTKNCYNMDCSDNWNQKQKMIINKPINGCECELNNCLSCPNLNLNQNLCTKCKSGYYKIENDSSSIEKYGKCYKEPNGYYLDINNYMYKECFFSCETCEKKGDNMTHNCLKCKKNFPIEIDFNNYTNCFENCTYYYYYDQQNYYHCTINSSCPNEYPVLIPETKECTNDYNKKYKSSEIIYDKYFSSIFGKTDYNEINYTYDQEIQILTSQLEKVIKIDDIINIIKKYKQLYNVNYVYFDYLGENLKLTAGAAKQSKVSGLRTDQILLMFASALKDTAKTLNIYIWTASQLSGDYKNAKELDAGYLRAAKSIADKVDVGAILMPVREQDQEAIKTYCSKGFELQPNFVMNIYEVRAGTYQNIKVYLYFDRSTCQMHDCFVTDARGEFLSVVDTNIEVILDSTREKEFGAAYTSFADNKDGDFDFDF
jgi:surface protein